MKNNMGSMDRIIRLVMAGLMSGLFLGQVVTGTLGVILVAISGVFVLTSFVGHCPLYLIFGINTCKK